MKEQITITLEKELIEFVERQQGLSDSRSRVISDILESWKYLAENFRVETQELLKERVFKY